MDATSREAANRKAAMRDEPLPHQQGYIGPAARIDIPLKSVTALRRIAEELRGLATNLEYLSRRTGERAGPVLFDARVEVRRANNRIAVIKGRGRPTSVVKDEREL